MRGSCGLRWGGLVDRLALFLTSQPYQNSPTAAIGSIAVRNREEASAVESQKRERWWRPPVS